MKLAPHGLPEHYRGETFFARSGLPLHVIHDQSQNAVPMHDHDFCELVLVLSGRGLHHTDTGEYAVAAGDVFLIRPAEKHGYTQVESFQIINLLFDPAGLGLPGEDLRECAGYQALFSLEPSLRQRHGVRNHLRLPLRDLAVARDLCLRIHGELSGKKAAYRSLVVAHFTALVVLLSRIYPGGHRGDPEALLRLAAALARLEGRWQEKIRLSELAAEARMTQSSFQRAFQRAMDCSPIDYLIRYRVGKAAELLARGELPVTQIAYRCGFDDGNYFSRKFRAVMGMTPRDYRQTHRSAAANLPGKPEVPG
ncbi:MAG: helix-turn-helix domain-containing protein [Spirochaetes bacterium]|nr:helix-turn-helix domain-containing protein [Spirochaetota bacterium]